MKIKDYLKVGMFGATLCVTLVHLFFLIISVSCNTIVVQIDGDIIIKNYIIQFIGAGVYGFLMAIGYKKSKEFVGNYIKEKNQANNILKLLFYFIVLTLVFFPLIFGLGFKQYNKEYIITTAIFAIALYIITYVGSAIINKIIFENDIRKINEKLK